MWWTRNQGWIQHDLVGEGGAELCAARPSTCKDLLDYCIWIVIVVHSSLIIMLLLKLLYLILSLIIFRFIMKKFLIVRKFIGMHLILGRAEGRGVFYRVGTQ
jgi:hypothetical protein